MRAGAKVTIKSSVGFIELFDLFDQKTLFFFKLFVLFVVLEVTEKGNEPLLVLEQDIQDVLWLVGVGYKHFKDMEGFELDVFALVSQQSHHSLQVIDVANIAGHHVEVGTIEQQLSQELIRGGKECVSRSERREEKRR